MEIHGYTESGMIDATIDGARLTVPDDLANRHRQMIAEWEAQGNTIPAYTASAPTSAMVWTERDRRLAAGFDYNFNDARGVHRIGTTTADLIGWDEVTKFSQALISTGNSSGTITILTDTGPAVVTALEWQQIMLAAAAFRQPIWGASFAIAAMDPIPADYATNEAYWP